MDSQILMRLNEIYRHDVYNEEVLSEETLSEEELVDINQWVSQLISEGYDLDDYSDEELYAAYLEDLDEALTGPRKEYALKRAKELRDRSRQVGDIAKRRRGGRHAISDKMDKRAADLVRVATREVGGEGYPRKEKGSWETLPRKRGGSGVKGDPKDMEFGVDHSRSDKSDKDLIKSKLRKRALRNINRGMNEELDLYDIVSEYLVSEGFCDSYDDADVIMANMSEEWRESVLDEVTGGGYVPRSGTTYSTDYRSSAQTRRDKHMSTPWGGRPGMEKSRQSAGIKSRTAVGSREEIPSRNASGTARSPQGAESGLAMTPQKRMETRAKSLELKGKTKQANKIRSVLDRP